MKNINKKLGKYPCRKCINKHYSVHLLPDDLTYFNAQEKCTACHHVGNIVADLKIAGRVKLLGKSFH